MTLREAYTKLYLVLTDATAFDPRRGVIPQSIAKPEPAKPQIKQKEQLSPYKYQQAAIKRQDTIQQNKLITKNKHYER